MQNLVENIESLKSIREYASAQLPTQFGDFRIVAFATDAEKLDHVALVRGDVAGKEAVPTRLHSECLTGDVFHSLRCDCRQQLEAALRHFAQLPCAIILYMRQEGRGIGIANKVAAYRLQEEGLDTVDANLHLGFDDDIRSYDAAAMMLKTLNVASIELYTNNPNKIAGLEALGIRISSRQPIVISPNEYNSRYLHTKQEKCGHLLGFDK